ncbi:MAG: glycoside hydrolase family 76 protein [Prevotellaceae bacterium]|nr:glycoside hydrolase family 76 protein [Prevotellaceae bacterium]
MKHIGRYLIVLLTFEIFDIQVGWAQTNENLARAQQILNKIYECYGEQNSGLLYENYPLDTSYTASYLASADTGPKKRFAYLWPFSGTFSGINAMLKTSKEDQYLNILKERTLPALQRYYDDSRRPPSYASYLSEAGLSDRFYDDNVWLGIDFIELYLQTNDKTYLHKAEEIWSFILSGIDNKLGGGIYWCEQKKRSKNTCSNAPASVLAFKLFQATDDSLYFKTGLELYEWTQKNLQDPVDKLYWDNIALSGKINKAKYPYNSGQMLQSASLLYKLTGNQNYLSEAQALAEACVSRFTEEHVDSNGQIFRLVKPGNVWFVAIMMRGFTELYHIDANIQHLRIFHSSLNYAWTHARDENSLFDENWTGLTNKKIKWLLNQAAFLEMYASIASIFVSN